MSEAAKDTRWVDLHLHTNHSDGSDAPARVVERAVEAGASAIAITDHDTVSGVSEAAEACRAAGLGFLPGTEISAKHGKSEVHILGLGINHEHAELRATLDRMAQAREDRARRMVEKLQNIGVPVSWQSVAPEEGRGVVGRMHLAQAVLATGYSRTIQDAFDKYLKAGRPAFVPREVLSAAEAVDTIHAAQGLAFVAHPGIGNLQSRLDHLLTLPFDGLEAYHSRHTPGQQAAFQAIAKERGLLVSGGSDCHGHIKGEAPLLGRVRVPYAVYERLLDRLQALKS